VREEKKRSNRRSKEAGEWGNEEHSSKNEKKQK